MRTKQVVDRQKAAQAVAAAAETQATEIVQGLTARFLPLLQRGEKVPDLGFLCELLRRQTAAATSQLLVAEEAYQKELLDDDPPRREREEAAAELSDSLVELREVLIGVFGSSVLKEAGFTQSTPNDPVQLSRLAGQVAQALLTVRLPASRVPGASLDLKALAADLTKKRARLDSALGAVAREAREAQAAMSQRNAALTEFDQSQGGVAAVLSGMLQLAGKPDLADRVRPTLTRRPARSEDPAPEPAPPPQ